MNKLAVFANIFVNLFRNNRERWEISATIVAKIVQVFHFSRNFAIGDEISRNPAFSRKWRYAFSFQP
jgi:hypothetical protein